MKQLLIIVFLALSFIANGFAQGVIKVTTDKSSYSYEDSIAVKVTLTNNTTSPFTIIGSSSCIAIIKFNDVRFMTMCTADQHEFYFSPRMSITWIWYLDPKLLGIPDKEGVQKIVGLCGNQKDSIYITAPKFKGGRIFVGKKQSVPEIEYQKLRDSIGATVISKLTDWSEYWSIKNHSIDSLVEKFSKDYRISSIEASRPLQFTKQIVTNVDNRENLPSEFSLSQNYPNPFNPITKIKYELPKNCSTRIVLYDNLGRVVKVLVNGIQSAGSYEISINAMELSSGVYYYRIQADEYSATKKFVLVK